ncbi:MAG: 50S ribosomal protein L24 [Acidobacteriota bacterium]
MKSKKLTKNLKVGDIVAVISGKDKRKTGQIKSIDRTAMLLLVEGISISKKHVKRSSQAEGGILEKESWFSISKVRKQ